MLRRFSWPDATRAQRVSAILGLATILSIICIYFVYYGYCFLVAHEVMGSWLPFAINDAAPSADGSVDPTFLYDLDQLFWTNFGMWLHEMYRLFTYVSVARTLFFSLRCWLWGVGSPVLST